MRNRCVGSLEDKKRYTAFLEDGVLWSKGIVWNVYKYEYTKDFYKEFFIE